MTRQLLLTMSLAACGGGGSTVDANLTTADAPAGANTIAGAVDGIPFANARSTLWAGNPDNPTTDTVIYVFDHPIACAEIVDAGWDTKIAAGTEILELKVVGKTAQAYPTTTAATRVPATGESASSFTVAAGTATDVVATGGSVTVSTIESAAVGHFVAGSFHITFPNGTLDGTFTSPFCSAGREP